MGAMDYSNLTNQFLIAMPSLADPNFHHTVTYICAHNEEGAMGIVINRPLGFMFSDVIEQMELKTKQDDVNDIPVYNGGPVQVDRGFVLHDMDEEWDSSLRISDDIGMTTSRDILEAIALGNGPKHALIALGYAGWEAGQLEEEIRANSWINVPATPALVFDTPFERRWANAADTLGIDLSRISPDAGHA